MPVLPLGISAVAAQYLLSSLEGSFDSLFNDNT